VLRRRRRPELEAITAERLPGTAWADVAAGVVDATVIELDCPANKLVSAPMPSSARSAVLPER
jgi:hypothetical protein